MTNVIKFPGNNFNKNSKQVVKVTKSNRNSYVIMASLFCLVMGLSVFNKKFENGFNNPTKGMRGLASVDQSAFDMNNEKLIALINSKKSRRIASFGAPSKDVDELMFGELSERFRISRDASNLVTSIERIPGATGENEKQFDISFLEKYKKAFGAERLELKTANVPKDGNMLLSTYTLYNGNNKAFAKAKVITTNVSDLVSITLEL